MWLVVVVGCSMNRKQVFQRTGHEIRDLIKKSDFVILPNIVIILLFICLLLFNFQRVIIVSQETFFKLEVKFAKPAKR